MTPEDVKAAWETADRAGKAYTASVLAFQQTMSAYRKSHPAPEGRYWAWYNGGLRLLDSPIECTHYYGDGFRCGMMPVVAWDDAGGAYCEEHQPKET